MRYITHDIHKNFSNAAGSEDQLLMTDMLAYELAKLVHTNKAAVIKVLQNNTIQISDKASEKETLSKTIDHLGGIGTEISKLIMTSKYSGADGVHFNAIDPITGAEELGKGILDWFSNKDKSQAQADADQQALKLKSLDVLASLSNKGLSGGAIAGIVIGSLAFLGLMTWLILRTPKSKA